MPVDIPDLVRRCPHLDLTYDELESLIMHLFPVAEIHTDNDGQILIYTGLRGSHGLEVIDAND
jgi:hypothetical protein